MGCWCSQLLLPVFRQPWLILGKWLTSPKEAIEKEEEKLVEYRTLKNLHTWDQTKGEGDREKFREIGEICASGSEKSWEQHTAGARCLQDFKKKKLHGNFLLDFGDISNFQKYKLLRRTRVKIHKAEDLGVTSSDGRETAMRQ